MKYVYRMQSEVDHRGPFRPGLTNLWAGSQDKPSNLVPPWIEACISLEQYQAMCRPISPRGMIGCGCWTLEKLHEWFDRDERKRLMALGFYVEKILPTRVIFDLPNQVVFEFHRHFERWSSLRLIRKERT